MSATRYSEAVVGHGRLSNNSFEVLVLKDLTSPLFFIVDLDTFKHPRRQQEAVAGRQRNLPMPTYIAFVWLHPLQPVFRG